MSDTKEKTIRVLFPQWQGGNQELYGFGSHLLAWLAPQTDAPLFRIDVPEYSPENPEPQAGIIYRNGIEAQTEQAYELLDRENPDNIIIFGGDCMVDQAPFAWLNEKHGGGLGVLWIDAHPDVKTPKDSIRAHTMVLGNLLGEGDPALASKVSVPLRPANVMFAGLREEWLSEQEKEFIGRHGLKNAKAEVLYESSQPVLDWIKEHNITHLAVHFDLDAMDPETFRSLLFAEPESEVDWKSVYPVGKLKLEHVIRLINDVSEETNVVALGITEHLPWDAWNLKQGLSLLSIMNK